MTGIITIQEYVKADCIEVTVEGKGSDLWELIGKRRGNLLRYRRRRQP